jgi:chromosome segregation ATPase
MQLVESEKEYALLLEVEKLRQRCTTLDDCNSKLSDEVEKLRQRCTTLDDCNSKLSDELAPFLRQRDAERKQRAEIQQLKVELERSKAEFQRQNRDLRTKLEAAERKLCEIQEAQDFEDRQVRTPGVNRGYHP